MQSVDPRAELARRIVREVGRRALATRGRAPATWKRPGERLTEADLAIQSRMVAEIETWFPADGILAEEGMQAIHGEREFVWVLDPIDGTNNYALGIPCFAISIGILRGGAPWAGVVHDPNTGFTAWAVQGQGAHVADRRLALEPRPLHPASNVAVRVPLDAATRPVALQWLGRHKLRNFGSVALHLAYAALGALDVVLDHQAALWDLAAGAALLLEAGGRITDAGGQPIFPVAVADYHGQPLRILAGNPAAHAEAVAACLALLESLAPTER
jgi:myo-inositol-1(or 4)-monophosphatase